MALAEKLYKSRKWDRATNTYRYESEVVDLVQRIEARADGMGLTVSRWETSGPFSSHDKTITWAVHSGERPERSGSLPDYAPRVVLSNVEGQTKRCEAFKRLSELLYAF